MRSHRPVTAKELAEHFSVTPETVSRWVREQRIPCVRPSRRVVRFYIEEVEHALRALGRQDGEASNRG